eukprot:TRINITY_DN6256_c0_g1_i2.p1 TRINITY_DN6256_c0_g1~~TRINITY_DN6256_c0_g1_i2.p1  ORF type:complete len:327 (-),score=23.17 TRINITY_DN6256_c0_g1_i2:9-962(-)
MSCCSGRRSCRLVLVASLWALCCRSCRSDAGLEKPVLFDYWKCRSREWDNPVTRSPAGWDLGHVWKRGRLIRFAAAHVLFSVFWRGNYSTWEDSTFAIFERFAADQVVLDVGAWVGPTAIWTSQLARQVVAMEPSLNAFSMLEANIWANRDLHGNLIQVNAALDAQDRTRYMSKVGDGRDTFSDAWSPTHPLRVRCVTIHTMLREFPTLEDVSFIKMDVEGHEAVLVPAMRDFFLSKRPTLLVSLHPGELGGYGRTTKVVNALASTFPFLYEADMVTPFNIDLHRVAPRVKGFSLQNRTGINLAMNVDVLATWHRLR